MRLPDSEPGDQPAPRLDTTRPFTRADALEAGISARVIRGSRFRRIFRDVYISSDVPPALEHRLTGALLLHPEDAFVSHSSAAAHYGVVVPHSALTHVSVFKDKDRRWTAGVKPHVAPEHTEVVIVRGIRVSGRIRMFIELAAILEFVDLVVAGDNMLKVFDMSAAELRAGLAKSRDYWSAAARYAAQFVRDEVDSPMETRLRMLIVLAGLPEPEVNIKIRDHNGEVVMRFDMGYRERRISIEYLGKQHILDIGNWKKDIGRDEDVDLLSYKQIKVTSDGVYVDPGATVQRVWRALCSRGNPVPPPTDAWKVHFPGRRRAG